MRNRLTCAVLLGVLLPAGFVKAAAPHAQDADAPTVHKNVVYGMHCGLALLMDVYEPAESNGHALLSIAGTGWHWSPDYGAGGIKDAVASGALGGGRTRVFADAGFTVFVINHRQAPLFRYPAAVEDARRAVRYIRHHGDEYGVTEDAIAAFGISSGAHLVLMLALGDGDGDPESADEVERHSSKVDVVASFAGPTDLTAEDWAETRGATYVTSFIGAPNDGLSNGRHRNASPLTYVDGESPPVLLIHGDADDVVPVSQARMLAASLREHEVEFEYVEIAGGGHDFDAVLNHDPKELPSFPAMARWLREHLPIDDHYFDSAGMTIRYIDVGPRDGEPVVLLHGFSQRIESAWSDTGVIEALDDEYRVIAMDWRGHGKSDTPHDPEAYGIEIVHDVVRLLDHLQLEKAHVVGYSMGGHIALRLLADHPDRVLSAMPCGDAGTHYPRGFDEVARRAVASLRTSGSIRPLIEYFAAPGSMTEDQVMAIVESQRSSNDGAALAAVMKSFRTLDADPAKLAATTVPCLAIVGEHDPFLDGLLATAENMTSLEVRVVEGCDHITVFQSPEYTALIRSFLDTHAGLGAAGADVPAAGRDLAHDPFPEAQAELRAVLDAMIRDVETANVQGLRDVHLDTHKFTKFGGGSVYERMDYEQTVETETATVTSVDAYESEMRELKIDVFGEVAVATYYPHRRVTKDGEVQRYSTRQTLVFLRTPEGWKIVHEHQSGRKYEEQDSAPD